MQTDNVCGNTYLCTFKHTLSGIVNQLMLNQLQQENGLKPSQQVPLIMSH